MFTHVEIVENSKYLPTLPFESFFHSRDLFDVIERTPFMSPCMAIAYDEKGHVKANLLASLRRLKTWSGFYSFKLARIYGEGVYYPDITYKDKIELFDKLMEKIMDYLLKHNYFHIEISDITKKTFGYKTLRKNKFVPIPWMKIHNSLHSKIPEERIFTSTKKLVDESYKLGVVTRETKNENEISLLYKLIKNFYRLRKQRYIPHEKFFKALASKEESHFYITLYKNKIIGGSVVVDSKKESMLWFDVALRKSYKRYHPHEVTLWYAIKETHRRKQDHIHLLNIGLPFNHSSYRDFMLSFGGKLVSSYRWFRYSNSIINKFMLWHYQM